MTTRRPRPRSRSPLGQHRCIIDRLEPRTLLAVNIMPLGDSITEGYNGPEQVSYRFWLWKKLTNAGYDVNFVGTRDGNHHGTPLYTDWDDDHEARSGWRADQIVPEITNWANTTQPDIVLLHAGTNDMFQSHGIAKTIGELGQIIDNLRVARPNVHVFLAKIIPSTIAAGAIVSFNNLIPGLVADKDTPQSRVILVDQHTGFSATADNHDGIHPNWRGERKMSRRWFDAMVASNLLPAPTPPPPPAITYLSDLTWTSATNGSGPVELDQSVGGSAADDGGALWLDGTTYARGLGTRANAEVIYDLGGNYARFLATVGIDDAAGTQGSAVFQVWVDGVKLFDSGVRSAAQPAQTIDVLVAGKDTLRLVVTDGGNGNTSDLADWANARLTTQPSVASSSYIFNTAPHELRFTFRGNVSSSLTTDDIVVENLTTSQTVPTSAIAIDYDDATNTATFTFTGFQGGVVYDGRYRARIVGAGVTDAAGNPMTGDYTHLFFFLMGDANHDGHVNLDDFDILAANFGQNERNFSQGDFSYDGTVNLIDFNLLAARFGASVSPSVVAMRPRDAEGGAWSRVRDVVESDA